MNSILDEMFEKYHAVTLDEKKNAVKEIIQEIVLCGLSRAGFFEKAAFYGGTALRIFYGLDRFSEDLDFALLEPDESFDLTSYFPVLKREVESYGLKLSIEEKQKTIDSHVKSAFLKGNTQQHLLLFYSDENLIKGIQSSELIKVKFEVDVFPPRGANYERKYALLPSPYEVLLHDIPSLFAGKIHAVLCRGWKNRVKGRDLYDFLFYLQKGAKINLDNLKYKLIESGRLEENSELTLDDVKKMLIDRFNTIDFENAKMDVMDYIHNPSSIRLWSKDFFIAIVDKLQ